MRSAAALFLALLATPALAGVLPLDGAYGNAAGCHYFATGDALGVDMLLLTPDTFAARDIGCDLDSATRAGDVFAVTGVCSRRGAASVTGDILDVKVNGRGYLVLIAGSAPIGPLFACVELLERGTPV